MRTDAVDPSSDPKSPPSAEHPDFVDISEILNIDGIRVIISQRKDSGRLTFGIFRRYLRGDGWKRTSFIPEILMPSTVDALALAAKRMDDIRKNPGRYDKLVKPVPPLDTAGV